ncbi:hypothetical protein R6Q59_025164 [Mikania micrantha]
MEHPKNTQMMKYQYLVNGVPFQSSPVTFFSDGMISSVTDTDTMSFNSLSPTTDVDYGLPTVFSLLNLSPATCSDRPAFLRSTPAGQVGSSVFSDEGFETLRRHSDLGVDVFLNRHRWSDDMEARRRHCSSGFGNGIDFDQKLLYSSPQIESITRCSSNLASEIVDKKLKFQCLDDYEQQNPCCCSKFQNQNQNFIWSLKELRGRIFTMAKDQNGCRILQTMIERSTVDDVEIVVSEVVDFISDLMNDQFGNYLVQKLVTLCNDDQKMRLIISLTKLPTDIILVCMNPHGTRAVQKLLENLNPNQVKLVVKALYRGAATLAVDPNGHHVIQYCLINFHSEINKPILTEIASKCYKIATDRSGCCVIQACVEHSRGDVRTRIITEIMTNAVHLAEDPFGNYVLQHIVGLKIQELTALLVRQLQGHFASLSCNKYASNVVEKCLNESGEEVVARIIMELVRSPNSSLLLVDPYANFVIQSALKVSKGFAQECLCGLISKNMLSMRTNLYGKKILERLEKKKVNYAKS